MANARVSIPSRAALNRRQRRAAAALARRAQRASLSAAAAITLSFLAASEAHAGTFEVTTLADAGAGSLRAAITSANAASGGDVISFADGVSGIITLTSGELTISDSVEIRGPGSSTVTVSGNDASRVLFIAQDPNLEVSISGLKIAHGLVNGNGAGIQSGAGRLALERVELIDNNAGPQTNGQGGGLWVSNAAKGVSIKQAVIRSNSARSGGGVFVGTLDGQLDIDSTLIDMNQSEVGAGMLLDNLNQAATIHESTIANNTAAAEGGGIRLRHAAANGPFTLRASTISGNTAASGGAISIYGTEAATTIESSTISGNQATSASAIYCYDCFPLTIRHATIAANSTSPANQPAGENTIDVGTSSISMSHVIFADNTVPNGKNLKGVFSADHSLIENAGTQITDHGGNLGEMDPQLGPLQDNGGPTFTMLPAETSPVIDAGDAAIAAAPSTDQRLRARIVNNRIDLGPVERNAGSIQFSMSSLIVAEDAGSAMLSITRTEGTDGDVSVSYATKNGTATAPDDYTIGSGALQWGSGVSAPKTVQVVIRDDERAEATEMFSVALSNVNGAKLGSPTALTLMISDADAAPTISPISDQTLTAGSSTPAIGFTIGDADGKPAELMLSATSSNAAVVPMSGISLGGSDEERTVIVSAPAGAGGDATITIAVTDGANTAMRAFDVRVSATPGDEPIKEGDGDSPGVRVDAGAAGGGEPAADGGGGERDDNVGQGMMWSRANASGKDSACGCNVPGRPRDPTQPLIVCWLSLAAMWLRRRRAKPACDVRAPK